MNRKIENAFDATMRIIELNQQIESLSTLMKKTKNKDVYRRLEDEMDRLDSEFLQLKHALQDIKMPILV